MSFVGKLRSLTTKSKCLNQETDNDDKLSDCTSSNSCNSPCYSVGLKNKVNQSREKEKQNEYIANLNAWAISLGYEAPNKLMY